MSKIEQVARAIAEASLDTGGSAGTFEGRRREYQHRVARAAIEAMREPTDAMIKAADKAMLHRMVDGPERISALQAGYRSMIDAALSEVKG